MLLEACIIIQGKKNTYNDISLERLSRECGTEPINLSLDEPLEEKIEE